MHFTLQGKYTLHGGTECTVEKSIDAVQAWRCRCCFRGGLSKQKKLPPTHVVRVNTEADDNDGGEDDDHGGGDGEDENDDQGGGEYDNDGENSS